MTRIVVEEDHFLKVLAVVLDPTTSDPQCRAVEEFFAHDEPDFLGWSRRLREKIPGLYPAEIVFAADENELVTEMANAEGAVVESLRVTAESLEAINRGGSRRLAIVHKYGTITSNIDLAACVARGVTVATLRRRVNVAVAEQAFALMIALAKRIGAFNGIVEEPQLRAAGLNIRPRRPGYIGYSNYAGITGLKTLMGSTLGILGMGEVGREVARRGRAFEMDLLYYQRTPLPDELEASLGARYVPLDGVLAAADFLIVQLPLTEKTRGIIGAKEFARMKPGVVLVDVARPDLLDRDALVEALAAGRLGGLGLDVLYSEPSDPAEPLLRFRGGDVILMPHLAVGARANALQDVETLCLNLWRAIVERDDASANGAAV